MQNETCCQSCGITMNEAGLWGTEANGLSSEKYCKHCYQNGAFVLPGITLEEMQEHLMKKMDQIHIPADITEAVIKRLPNLERWKTTTPITQ